MLYYNRIEVFEGVDVNKKSMSKKCIIIRYSCFLNKGFKFQSSVYNDGSDVLMMSFGIKIIVVLNIDGIDYCSTSFVISKNETIYIMRGEIGSLQDIKRIVFFLIIKVNKKCITNKLTKC